MIIGIDIGVTGAVAVLDQDGALVEVHDMPTLQDGPKGRRSVNAPLLASLKASAPGQGKVLQGLCFWPRPWCHRRRSRRRWRPCHVYNAACMEASHRANG
jgi:hypothetical protein